MKNNAVVTISIGKFYENLSELTHPTIKQYADRIGADFIVLSDQGDRTTPHYRKLDIKNLFDKGYKRIIYVDTDIIIRDDCPDLFTIVPENKLGILNENKYTSRTSQFFNFLNDIKYSKDYYKNWDWNGEYYNTGIFVLSAEHAEKFLQEPDIEHCHFYEQSWLNLCIQHNKIPVMDLPYKFNRMTCMEGLIAETRFDSFCIHYAGAHYVLPEDQFLNRVKADLDTWNKDKNFNYKYKKKFLLKVSGGLGDVVAAEPAVRFFCQKEFPEQDIILLTAYPEIFKHLESDNIKCKISGIPSSSIPDLSERRVLDTLHTVDHPYFSFVLPLSTHQVTIASQLLFRYDIPPEDKTINIPLTSEEFLHISKKYEHLKDCVIVHPGKHWQSKTFPKDVWQDYINILVNNGFKVVVVGKEIDYFQGTVQGLDLSKCENLINKTSTRELVGLFHLGKVLISNDSSPVHLAGATDINIGLIPTSKRDWCILPHRNGTIRYKTKSLYNQPMWDDYPSNILITHSVSVEHCKESRIRECLPKCEDILNYVKSCY